MNYFDVIQFFFRWREHNVYIVRIHQLPHIFTFLPNYRTMKIERYIYLKAEKDNGFFLGQLWFSFIIVHHENVD